MKGIKFFERALFSIDEKEGKEKSKHAGLETGPDKTLWS